MEEVDFAPISLQRRIDEELARRILDHQAAVARLEAARQSAETLEVPVLNKPAAMLAVGDSWFDYPLNGNGLPLGDTDIIAQLRKIGNAPPLILNLAHRGDASTDEMSLPKQQRIISALTTRANWPNGKPDAILFSAGGNDIAGDQFCIFLDFNDGRRPGLNASRFSKAMGMVEASYLALFALRDRLAPGVPIFGHCYDFPIPNGVHPACAGPWLKPSLDFCNWSVKDGTKIVHDALSAFRVMQKRLAADPANNFHLVDTQGVLTAAEWANELHPYPGGFMKLARKLAADLSQTFQGIAEI